MVIRKELFIFTILPNYNNMRKYPKIGEKFGDWIIVSENVEKYQRWYKFHVRCKCGFEKFVLASTLRRGKSTCCKKCGEEKHYKGIDNLSSTFFTRIKEGAKKRNIKVDITPEYILNLLINQDYKCALSGVELILSRSYAVERMKSNNSTTASLDRIDPKLGYIEGNVQWIHKDVNYMKNDYNQDYFIEMCKLIAENYDKSSSSKR